MSFRQTLPRLTQNSKSKSSKQWISRQLRDPYVKKRLVAANDDDPAASYSYYRSRSAFKLLEINDRMGGGGGGFLDCEDVRAVVDLGAAPGGWSQVVARKLGWSHAGDSLGGADALSREFEEQVPFHLSKGRSSRPDDEQVKKPFERHLVDDRIEHDLLGSRLGSLHRGRGTIVAVDLLPIVPIPGVHIVRGDFLLGSTIERVRRLLASKGNASGKADVILSDMAANISGNAAHDTESSLEICESVFEFARANLGSADVIGRKKGGVLLVKFFAHPLLDRFRKESLEPNFHYVRYIKPDSSRAASREGYFLCQGWAPR